MVWKEEVNEVKKWFESTIKDAYLIKNLLLISIIMIGIIILILYLFFIGSLYFVFFKEVVFK